MPYTVYITKVETGETRTHEVPNHNWEDEGPGEFRWTEGGDSCDCNRDILFSGVKPTDAGPCGDTRFKIRVTENGVDVYNEQGTD